MGLISVSHKDVPLSWNINLMGLFRAFVEPTQNETDPLWEPVFLPYELGLRAIHADKMTPEALRTFVDLLKSFAIEGGLSDPLVQHVECVISDLEIQLAKAVS